MLKKISLMEQNTLVDYVDSKSNTLYPNFSLIHLFYRFNKIYPKPDWARLPSEIQADERKRKAADSDDEDDAELDEEQLEEEARLDLLKSTIGILSRRSNTRTISPKKLDILRLKNANRAVPRTNVRNYTIQIRLRY